MLYLKNIPIEFDYENADTTRTFQCEFDERGDKMQIYDHFRELWNRDFHYMEHPYMWMMPRAIRQHDNQFIKWLICSYPEDMEWPCYRDAIEADNAEAFHLLESAYGPPPYPKDLINYAESFNRPEYAEYIRNHYDLS